MAATNRNSCTEYEERFSQAYVANHGDEADAYRSVYSTRNLKPAMVKQKARKVLQKPTVQRRIDELRARVLETVEVTRQRVITEIVRIAYANVDDYVSIQNGIMVLHDYEGMTRDDRAAISSMRSRIVHRDDEEGATVMQVELRLGDKLKALQMLGAYLGMWDGKGEPTGGIRQDPEVEAALATMTAAEKLAFLERLASQQQDRVNQADSGPEAVDVDA